MQREIGEASAVTGEDLARLDSFRAWSARQAAALAARAAELHRAVSEQTARVVAADRNVRLIERLRERRREEWCEEEQRGLDEMAGESSVAQWRRRQFTLRR
jgi:hypothetical protein